jgi:phage terminase large subunit-like protein
MKRHPRFLSRVNAEKRYADLLKEVEHDKKTEFALIRELAKTDLYFLALFFFGREEMKNDWVYARIREVEAEPDGYMDLWAREHFKSSIITFLLTIQNILNNPEWTFGIFSFTRPIAKAFLRQIKIAFETNEKLKYYFSDVLYDNPSKQSPKWSEDDGIIVKRKGNQKESTVEAWGLIDSQPTSKHFTVLIYDDVETKQTASTPEMNTKTLMAYEASENLGIRVEMGGKKRLVGTIWHHAGLHVVLMNRGVYKIRKHPATDDGTRDGKPVLLTQAELDEKKKSWGPETFACQMLLNPSQSGVDSFRPEYMRYWTAREFWNLNIYILVDPAKKKTKSSDYTVFLIIGLGADRNYYVIDMVREKLSLAEKRAILFGLHQKYQPIGVGYEEYGMQTDIEYFHEWMDRANYRFHITPMKGIKSKQDRIATLVPYFKEGRFWFPERLLREDEFGQEYNLIDTFINDELRTWPYGSNDDMLDVLARCVGGDIPMYFPQGEGPHIAPRQSKGYNIYGEKGYSPKESGVWINSQRYF